MAKYEYRGDIRPNIIVPPEQAELVRLVLSELADIFLKASQSEGFDDPGPPLKLTMKFRPESCAALKLAHEVVAAFMVEKGVGEGEIQETEAAAICWLYYDGDIGKEEVTH